MVTGEGMSVELSIYKVRKKILEKIEKGLCAVLKRIFFYSKINSPDAYGLRAMNSLNYNKKLHLHHTIHPTIGNKSHANKRVCISPEDPEGE